MRWIGALVPAACGSHPVDLGDGASNVGIGCNKAQPLPGVTAAIPRLAVAASGSHIVDGWTADDATFGDARITLDGTDHVAAVERDGLGSGGNYTGVSLAMSDDDTVLVALARRTATPSSSSSPVHRRCRPCSSPRRTRRSRPAARPSSRSSATTQRPAWPR